MVDRLVECLAGSTGLTPVACLDLQLAATSVALWADQLVDHSVASLVDHSVVS